MTSLETSAYFTIFYLGTFVSQFYRVSFIEDNMDAQLRSLKDSVLNYRVLAKCLLLIILAALCSGVNKAIPDKTQDTICSAEDPTRVGHI